MSAPILPLRAAIRAVCLSDPALAAAMGGAVRLYDEPPRGAEPVYGLFGDALARDLSGSEVAGHEQELALVVWAARGSAAGAIAAAGRLAALLDDAPLSLLGHRLVHLTVVAQEVDRDPDTDLARVTVRLRAVTEVET